MTKTVTLRDDLLELANLLIKSGLEDYARREPTRTTLTVGLALDFLLGRLKELQEAFAKATEATTEATLSVPAREREPLEVTWAEANNKPVPPPAAESKPKKTQPKAKPAEPDRGRKTPNWTLYEDDILLGYKDVEPKHWSEIVARLPGRNVSACKSRLKRLTEKAGTLHTDADGTVTSARMVEPPVSGEMSTQEEIVAKVRANTSWPVARDDGIVPAEQIKEAARSVPFDATEMVQPLSHPAIKADDQFIKPLTALEKMVGGFKRSGL